MKKVTVFLAVASILISGYSMAGPRVTLKIGKTTSTGELMTETLKIGSSEIVLKKVKSIVERSRNGKVRTRSLENGGWVKTTDCSSYFVVTFVNGKTREFGFPVGWSATIKIDEDGVLRSHGLHRSPALHDCEYIGTGISRSTGYKTGGFHKPHKCKKRIGKCSFDPSLAFSFKKLSK
ncbi:hypothetical protein ACFL2F_01135 [Myxococcota bacterium]